MRGVAPGSLPADRTDPPPPPPPPAMLASSTRPALTHRRRRRLSCSASHLASQRSCQDTNRDAAGRGESTGQATKKKKPRDPMPISAPEFETTATQLKIAVCGTELKAPFEEHGTASSSCRPALGWLVQSYEVRDALKHGPLCIALAQACRANGQTCRCRLHTTLAECQTKGHNNINISQCKHARINRCNCHACRSSWLEAATQATR